MCIDCLEQTPLRSSVPSLSNIFGPPNGDLCKYGSCIVCPVCTLIPSQSLPESAMNECVLSKCKQYELGAQEGAGAHFSVANFSTGGEIIEHFFLRTAAFMYEKGTCCVSAISKNRLISELDVQWVPPPLGMNANALNIFFCIFAVLSAIYSTLCISFSPVWLTPKTTALNEQVSRGCRETASVPF